MDVDSGAPPSPAPSHGREPRQYAIDTEVVFSEGGDQYKSSSVPIYQTATFKQSSVTSPGEYDYTRSGNPTRSHLERHLAKLMNAYRVLAVSSGMTALDVIMRMLRPGDEVIAGDDLYGGSHRLLHYLEISQNIVVKHIDTTNTKLLLSQVNPKTRMVLLESPTNPLIKVCDLRALCVGVHEANREALVVIDNTMLSPLLMRPLDFGADIVYESGTKFLCGHHDIMAGVIAVRDVLIGNQLFQFVNAAGCGLAPFDCWLLMRGIKTLAVRLYKQQENAQRIAEFLESFGFEVLYPGLPSHPQHELHFAQASGAGAVLSFKTGDVALSERIVEYTTLWAISVSFGCVNSLISLPCKMSHASIDAKTRAEREFPEDLIRLCVGIENCNDLIDDLKNSFIRAGAIKVDEL